MSSERVLSRRFISLFCSSIRSFKASSFRLYRVEICCTEAALAKACSSAWSSNCNWCCNFHGRCLVREQHALGVLRIAEAVVHQIPVQSIDAGIGMATRTALPGLKAEIGVVKDAFRPVALRSFPARDRDARPGPDRTILSARSTHCQQVAEIDGDVDLGADHGESARSANHRPLVGHHARRRHLSAAGCVRANRRETSGRWARPRRLSTSTFLAYRSAPSPWPRRCPSACRAICPAGLAHRSRSVHACRHGSRGCACRRPWRPRSRDWRRPDRYRPSSTVLSSLLRATSMTLMALVFIQPRSNCVVGIW